MLLWQEIVPDSTAFRLLRLLQPDIVTLSLIVLFAVLGPIVLTRLLNSRWTGGEGEWPDE